MRESPVYSIPDRGSLLDQLACQITVPVNAAREKELLPEATIKKYLIVQTEGSRQVKRLIDHYNLEMTLAIGFRVRSRRGSWR